MCGGDGKGMRRRGGRRRETVWCVVCGSGNVWVGRSGEG